jgi:hypothetical protein
VLAPVSGEVAVVAVDYSEARNLTVHDHYEKRPSKPKGTWMLDKVMIGGPAAPGGKFG